MNPGQSAAYAAKLRVLLPIMDAHARGETIEYCAKGNVVWSVVGSPIWDVKEGAGDYRVKPQPRTFYLVRFSDSSTWCFYTKKEREEFLSRRPSHGGTDVLDMLEIL